MAALTADFNSNIQNQRALCSYPILAATMATSPAYAGGFAQLDSLGNVAPAVVGSANVIVGQFAQAYKSNNPQTVLPVREGDVLCNLATLTPPTQANVGAVVYAYDDNSVTTTAGSSAKAGILISVGIEPTTGVSMARVRCTLEANT